MSHERVDNDVCVDVILAGGGAAGLSLAYHLHQALPELSLLIVDDAVKRTNDHAWCFWSRQPSYLDAIAYRSWNRLSIVDDHRQMTFDLAPYRYTMVRAGDFHRFIRDTLADSPRVSFVLGTVDDIVDGPDGVEVTVNGLTYGASWAFDSRYRPSEYRPLSRQHHYLTQHFVGWQIETEHKVLDSSTPCIFDFRTPQSGAMCFFYVLPYSATTGLVEYTVFSDHLFPVGVYREALKSYIDTTLGASTYRIIDEEHDIIPLTDHVVPRRTGHRVLNIGTRGGRVKASSGYAFHRIQQDSAAIAHALKTRGHPFALPRPPRRYHTFDAMLLHILERHGELGHAVFTRLFNRNPIQRIFRFLDEEGSMWENLQLMATVPPWPFIAAWLALKTVRHPLQEGNLWRT